MRIRICLLFCFSLMLFGQGSDSFVPNDDLDFAQVVEADARLGTDGLWTFSVTLRHHDEDWDHYADRWIVVNPLTDEVLAERILTHPHVNEQPFTRSLSGVEIPAGLGAVEIRARCNKHGYEGKRLILELTREE